MDFNMVTQKQDTTAESSDSKIQGNDIPKTTTPKLEIKDVGKIFKTKSGETVALEKTSFTVEDGEFRAILRTFWLR